MIEPLLRVKDVAQRLGMSQMTIYGWLRRHGLPHIKIDQHYLFDWNDVLSWLKTKKVN